MQYYRKQLTLRDFFYFSCDLKSPYKSVWLGPLLITWNFTWPERHFGLEWNPD